MRKASHHERLQPREFPETIYYGVESAYFPAESLPLGHVRIWLHDSDIRQGDPWFNQRWKVFYHGGDRAILFSEFLHNRFSIYTHTGIYRTLMSSAFRALLISTLVIGCVLHTGDIAINFATQTSVSTAVSMEAAEN